jgi:hypothetical protein
MMNDDLERTGKYAVIAQLRYYPGIFLGYLGKKIKLSLCLTN